MKKPKKLLLTGIILAVVFLIVLLLGYKVFFQTTPLAELIANKYELKPAEESFFGIEPESAFILKSDRQISVRDVRKIIKFTPGLEYNVSSITGKEFSIKPEVPLERNKIYKISLTIKKRNWAFQVRDKFKVLRSLPRDHGTGVPLNSGIEVVFNFKDFINYKDKFSISPKTRGRFEKHKNTLVFVPKELKPATIYTVSIKKNLGLSTSKDTLGEDYVFHFETKKEKEEEHRRFSFGIRKSLYEYAKEIKPIIDIYAYDLKEKSIPVKVFAFANLDEFMQAMEEQKRLPRWTRYGEHCLDTSKLRKVLDFKADVQEANYWTKYFVLPDKLEEGYYLVDTEVRDVRAQAFVQVTDLAVYAQTSRTKTVIWVNDLKSKAPIQNAAVQIVGTEYTFRTNEQGIVSFDTLNVVKERGFYFRVSAPGQKGVLVPSSAGGEHLSTWDKYWYYLYTDRKLYQPTDTVKIWGIIRPREGKIEGTKVAAELIKSGWPSVFVTKTEMKLSDWGTFTGEIDFKDLQPGYYNLHFKLGDRSLRSQYFQIQTYTKPAYKIDIEQSKKAVFLKEEAVTFTVKSQFFEGTPLAHQKLRYVFSDSSYFYRSQTGKEIETDINGAASIDYKPRRSGTIYLHVTPARAEEAEISASTSLRVFYSHVSLQTEANVKNKVDGEVKIKANHVDLTKINEGKEEGWNDFLGGPASDQPIEINLTEIWYEKEETGDYYDFINKKVYKLYRCNRITKRIETKKVKTDAAGQYIYTFKLADPNKSYSVHVSTRDHKGRHTDSDKTLWSDMNYYFNTYSSKPILVNKKSGDPSPSWGWHYDYYWSAPRYHTGEKVEFDFVKEGKSLPSGEGNGYLFYIAQKGLLDYQVRQNPNYGFFYNREYIPNLHVSGVYFDGNTYYESGRSVRFNTDERKLNIKIKTDKERYKPKDRVNLDLHVTDPKGKPARAEVNLNLVDEAFYMLSPEKVDPLSGIYSGVSSGLWSRYMTHQYPEIDQGAEKGGCFAGGTKILMADGSYKNIEEVEVGDIIRTRQSEKSSRLVNDRVMETFEHLVDEWLIINSSLKVTPEHIMLVNGQWQAAGRVKIGDALLDKNNKKIIVNSIKYKGDRTKVYNLRTESCHTFFADDIYVHNQKGEGAREDFPDMAFFGAVRTGSNGKAKVQFKLPDNLTSWRVTVQAISPNMYAGHTIGSIPVSLPFFVETTYNKEFHIQDEPVIKIRSFGKALQPKQKVEYSVFATSLGLESSEPLFSTAFKPVYFTLPSLKVGEHRIGVAGKTEKYKDTIIKPISVIKSRFKKRMSHYYKLAKDLKIKGSVKGRISLVFSDQNRGQFYWKLNCMSWTWGDRVDQKLARYFGKKLLNRYFKKEYDLSREIKVSDYQAPDGGISLLPYSDSEVPLSAKIAAIDPDLFSRTGLYPYFFQKVNDKKTSLDEKCPAWLGLASLGKGDLIKIKLALKLPKLTAVNRLYLGLALYKIGDEDAARETYKKVMKKYSKTKGQHSWVIAGKDMDDRLAATSLAAMLAAALDEPERDLLWNYAEVNYTRDILLNMEKIFYMKETIPRLPDKAVAFSVKTRKQKFEKVKLEKGRLFGMEVSDDELDSLTFYDIKGRVGLCVLYDQAVDPSTLSRDPNIEIKREYLVDGWRTNKFKEGDLVEVRFYTDILPNALGFTYQIIDALPSGLKIVTRPYSRGARGGSWPSKLIYPYQINNQQQSFMIGKRWDAEEQTSSAYYSYYAMVINKGKYVAEPAVIRSFINPEILNYSDKDTIEIN